MGDDSIDRLQLAIDRLESDHVQNNLHRMGLLGADDVRAALEFLQELKQLNDGDTNEREG